MPRSYSEPSFDDSSRRSDAVFQFTTKYLHEIEQNADGSRKFEIMLPTVTEEIPYEALVSMLMPQFGDDRKRTTRFVDDMMQELIRQQLADAIAQMIQL